MHGPGIYEVKLRAAPASGEGRTWLDHPSVAANPVVCLSPCPFLSRINQPACIAASLRLIPEVQPVRAHKPCSPVCWSECLRLRDTPKSHLPGREEAIDARGCGYCQPWLASSSAKSAIRARRVGRKGSHWLHRFFYKPDSGKGLTSRQRCTLLREKPAVRAIACCPRPCQERSPCVLRLVC